MGRWQRLGWQTAFRDIELHCTVDDDDIFVVASAKYTVIGGVPRGSESITLKCRVYSNALYQAFLAGWTFGYIDDTIRVAQSEDRTSQLSGGKPEVSHRVPLCCIDHELNLKVPLNYTSDKVGEVMATLNGNLNYEENGLRLTY